MAFISVSGIACAAPTAASAASVAGLALALGAAPAMAADLEVAVQGLRNTRGEVHLCLTRSPAHFPDCSGDPAMIRRTVPAAGAALIRIGGVPPGNYALSLIHDENGNGRLDTFLGIPREGFGFSRNPRLRMGPPRFEECRVTIGQETSRQTIAMKYLL